MIPRVVLLISLFVVATAYYDATEAEETKPIQPGRFNRKYRQYLDKLEECGAKETETKRKSCLDSANREMRIITHRAVNSEIIGEISCKKGEFGRFEIVIDGQNTEVDLPC